MKKVKKELLTATKKHSLKKSYFSLKIFSSLTIIKLPLLVLAVFLIRIGDFVKKVFSLLLLKINYLKNLIHLQETVQKKKSKKIKSAKVAVFHSYQFKLIILTAVFFLIVYSWWLVKFTSSLPSPDKLAANNRPLTTQIMDRNGKLLYQIYEGQNRKLVTFNELPKYLINATIAIEDKRFYYHPGIDPVGILRAIKVNLTGSDKNLAEQSKILAGGSTITQQLVKNTLLTNDQTLQRKLKEALLSIWVERIYSKNEILQMYFNEAPYGGPAWGIEAAAEMYFAKKAADLNLAEATFLAGLPAAPTEYSPYGTYPEKGKKRQQEVLRRMVEDGYINEEEANLVYGQVLNFQSPATNIKAPHFVMYVRSLLASRLGERAITQGGLKIVTTIDLDLQEMAEYTLSAELDKLTNLGVSNGGIVITDAKTGHILVMVGSKDYFDKKGGNFNTTLALRQPGSAIKPITYAAAFKQGFSPGTMILDAPTTFPDVQKPYSPVNYDGKFHGLVSIRTALASSYNVPAVKILSLVGLPQMIATAKDLGITTFNNPDNYGLSLTLGGGAVKLVDLVTAYGTFASNGIKHEATPILKITDSFGNILEDNTEPQGKKVLSEEIAYLINSILSDNQARTPTFGSNSLLQIPGKIIAAKTGTSDDKRDNWAIGYTREFVVGVWVGNNDNSPMDPKLSSGITGATPIWHNLMVSLLSERPNLSFDKPVGIVDSIMGGKKDFTISGQTNKTLVFTKKNRQKDSQGKDEEIITYSDPFSTFTPKTQTTQ